jgi:hypothetical protein
VTFVLNILIAVSVKEAVLATTAAKSKTLPKQICKAGKQHLC